MGGHYAEEYGTPICMQCPRGQYQDEKGQRGPKSFEHFDHGQRVLGLQPENRSIGHLEISGSYNDDISEFIISVCSGKNSLQYVQLGSQLRQGALTVSLREFLGTAPGIAAYVLYGDFGD